MFYTYIITNKRNGTLYTGHTDDLDFRMWQHANAEFKGFAARYGCQHLVWFEEHESRDAAFTQERQIKKWNRAWKLRLIENLNPNWIDIAAVDVWPLPSHPLLADTLKASLKNYALAR